MPTDDIQLTKLIRTMLSNRRFKVELNGKQSSGRNQRNGLPQGSVLSPLLFNVCTNDQPLPVATNISTTNLAACVCVSSKFDQFLPVRFYFVSKRPEIFDRIANFPYAAFGPLFAFHCPLFVTKNNNLG